MQHMLRHDLIYYPFEPFIAWAKVQISSKIKIIWPHYFWVIKGKHNSTILEDRLELLTI